MKINILLIYLTLTFSFTYTVPNKLEYDVKYSNENFILVKISKATNPDLKKTYHIVKEGEELEDISDDNKIDLEKLEKINRISRFDDLKPGTLIYFTDKKREGKNE